jgi:hypothetical protein
MKDPERCTDDLDAVVIGGWKYCWSCGGCACWICEWDVELVEDGGAEVLSLHVHGMACWVYSLVELG